MLAMIRRVAHALVMVQELNYEGLCAADFEAGDEMSQALHDALYDYYFDDMPYGVQKARTGDPYEWVSDRFGADLGISGYGHNSPGIGPEDDPSVEREGVDYAMEENLKDVWIQALIEHLRQKVSDLATASV